MLETLGVPVLGWRVDTLPRFYAADGGPQVSARVETADEAARIARAHWELGRAALLLGRPSDESLDVDDLIEEAVSEAHARGVEGQAVTLFVLSFLHDRSGGRTLAVNRELIAANAGLAAEIAGGGSAVSLWHTVADIDLRVDGYELETLEFSMEQFVRKTTVVHLRADGDEGLGEDITYEVATHDEAAAAGPCCRWAASGRSRASRLTSTTSASLGTTRAGRTRARLDLALRQAGLAGRGSGP